MSRWFRNGELVQDVSIDDRAFQYGDGLFETIAIRDGQPRLWEYHIDRLERGCERLGIAMPARRSLRESLDKAAITGAEDAACGTAKIIVSSGKSQRGYARAQPAEAHTLIGIFAATPVTAQEYRDGIETTLCNTRLALYSVTAGLKTLNRLEQVLARCECAQAGTFEGFTLDADDRLICGTMSNVFIVSNNSIITPALDRCGVEGVMRRYTIETLQENDTLVDVRDIRLDEFRQSDEAFLTNSQFGILPVRRCGDRLWQSHTVTRQVMATMADNGIGECAL